MVSIKFMVKSGHVAMRGILFGDAQQSSRCWQQSGACFWVWHKKQVGVVVVGRGGGGGGGRGGGGGGGQVPWWERGACCDAGHLVWCHTTSKWIMLSFGLG